MGIFDRPKYRMLAPGEDPTRQRQHLQKRPFLGVRVPGVVWLFLPLSACALSGVAIPAVQAWMATPTPMPPPPVEAPATVIPTIPPTETANPAAALVGNAAGLLYGPQPAPSGTPGAAAPTTLPSTTPTAAASPTAVVERVIVRETVVVHVTQVVDRRVQVNVPVQVTSIVQVTTVVQVTAPPVVWTAAPQATYTPYPTYTPPPTATPWIITATPEPTATLAPQELTPAAWVYLPTIWR